LRLRADSDAGVLTARLPKPERARKVKVE